LHRAQFFAPYALQAVPVNIVLSTRPLHLSCHFHPISLKSLGVLSGRDARGKNLHFLKQRAWFYVISTLKA